MVLVAVAVALLGGTSTARAEDEVGNEVGNYISGAGWKLFRGLTNVGGGLLTEMLNHAGASVSGPGATTIGSSITGFCSGLVTGMAYGVVRTGSGLADIATFPLPFIPVEDNRPLVEPEFAL
jgi:putative exosortase-associated protein (TIGR04073 family)